MRRVLVLGCPGSGKSMAARQLSAVTGLPVIHLDQHYWLPGWRRPDSASWTKIVGDLADQSAWIMDGNYSGSLEQRLARADTLIHLDYPTWLCLWRAMYRTVRGWGRNRNGELPPGCPERFDGAFLRFVLEYRRSHRERDLARMSSFSGQTFRFASPAALTDFIVRQKSLSKTGYALPIRP